MKVATKESERLASRKNCDKTCVLVASKKAEAPVCSVAVNSVLIEHIDHFKYLGRWITSDGRSDMDIRCRTGQAKQAFMDMKKCIMHKELRIGS